LAGADELERMGDKRARAIERRCVENRDDATLPDEGPMRDFALETYFARWQSATRHHLTASESETLTLVELLALADAEDGRQWETLALGYSDPRGAEGLRQAIAAGYECASADTVRCFAGAQEAIHVAMRALLGAGDHAIVVVPNYQSTETIPLGLSAVTGVALDPLDRWSLDIDAVAAAIRPNTRLISINFPNNPTGKILERERFDALVALARRHGLWLFSDEVYWLIERDPALRLPAASDVYERGISLGALSKSYGLPGLRIGWIVCRDRALLERIGRVKHYFSITNAAPCENLAGIALKAGERILRRNRAIAAQNIARLSDFFGARADLFDWYVPDGGVVGYPRYKGADGVEALCARLIAEHGVLLLPASVYRSDLLRTPGDRFRIGFGRSDLAPGLTAFAAGLRVMPAAARRVG
jgi:aspartate/methionine/tyrosine aminotransferase